MQLWKKNGEIHDDYLLKTRAPLPNIILVPKNRIFTNTINFL